MIVTACVYGAAPERTECAGAAVPPKEHLPMLRVARDRLSDWARRAQAEADGFPAGLAASLTACGLSASDSRTCAPLYGPPSAFPN